MPWTIEHSGGTASMDALGFGRLSRKLSSQIADVVTFDGGVDGIEDAQVIAPQDTVKIYRPDGVKWFEGVVTQTPLTALPESETHGYIVSGPWWHLEENVYKMPWVTGSGNINIGHLLLNIGEEGNLASTKYQIERVLNYLLNLFPSGAKPFQIGTIEPIAFPPVSEVNAASCAAVIRGQLRWVPDAAAWFDYSTSPPTFHVKQRSSLTTKNLAIGGNVDVQLVPRHDLVRPSIAILWEVTTVIDGNNKLHVEFDIAPPGATGDELRALNLTMNLQGPSVVRSFASLLCDGIDPTNINWWRLHHQPFNDSRYANFSISGITRRLQDGSPSLALPRELLEGQITEWMNFSWEQEVITAKISYDFYDRDPALPGAVKLIPIKDHELQVSLVSTNAITGDYVNVTTTDTGDPLPSNLAQFLYDTLSQLHYDGRISIVEDELTGAVGLGDKLNLTGGRAEWASMNALVQSIQEDADQGRTSIVVGPPKHLGPTDLMELLRVGRRARYTPAATLTTGDVGNRGEIKFGQATSNRDTNPGQAQYHALTTLDGTNKAEISASGKKLIISQEDARNVEIMLSDIPAGVPQSAMPLKIREFVTCSIDAQGNKTEGRALFLASGSYTPPP